MSTSIPFPQTQAIHQPFGLPQGTVRGFLSVLICSFFWIVMLLPEETPTKIPIAHFFLLTLVFLAFASNPHIADMSLPVLPWIMRLVFVGGSIAVIAYTAYEYPGRLSDRLTPDSAEIKQWPRLLATLSFGFAGGLFLRYVMGPRSHAFMTIRAWIGVLAILCLLLETLIQFAIIPNLSEPPNPERGLQFWEASLVGLVAAYFGSRA